MHCTFFINDKYINNKIAKIPCLKPLRTFTGHFAIKIDWRGYSERGNGICGIEQMSRSEPIRGVDSDQGRGQRSGAWTAIRGVDSDQGRGQRSGPWTAIRGVDGSQVRQKTCNRFHEAPRSPLR